MCSQPPRVRQVQSPDSSTSPRPPESTRDATLTVPFLPGFTVPKTRVAPGPAGMISTSPCSIRDLALRSVGRPNERIRSRSSKSTLKLVPKACVVVGRGILADRDGEVRS
jgi:hypothetical protein